MNFDAENRCYRIGILKVEDTQRVSLPKFMKLVVLDIDLYDMLKFEISNFKN